MSHVAVFQWLDDRLLVGTDTGDVLLFADGGEFRGTLPGTVDGPVESMAAHAKCMW